MSREPITVAKESEFFISIAKEGIHSFVMLGVVVDGAPQLLARVGKGNLIDKDFAFSAGAQIAMFKKTLLSYTDASLVDEGISDSEKEGPEISYQSYAITYEHYKEFLVLTRDIHAQQMEHYQERITTHQNDAAYPALSFPEKGVRKLTEGIDCFIPTHEEDGMITFNYQNINDYSAASQRDAEAARHEVIDGANNLHASNTCRTTARSILNYTLGYSPQVPALYAIGLDYKTKLANGVPEAKTFYILPQPPNVFDVSLAQRKTLAELYKRLEHIPKTNPSSDVTRKKFDEIKILYQSISSEPTLPLSDLLDKITGHRVKHNEIFDVRRGESIVSKFLKAIGMKTGTQKAYDHMEAEVRAEISRLGVGIAEGKKADEPEYQPDDKRPPTMRV